MSWDQRCSASAVIFEELIEAARRKSAFQSVVTVWLDVVDGSTVGRVPTLRKLPAAVDGWDRNAGQCFASCEWMHEAVKLSLCHLASYDVMGQANMRL